jgi:uncharacterized RDD family membrane protein YckC
MESTAAIGVCLDHPERSGTPCARCGTFRCGECLSEGLCPNCRTGRTARPPQPEETVGFGKRAGARIIDLIVAQVSALGGGVAAGIVLVVLQASGVVSAGWETRLDHGFGFNFITGSIASVIGMSLSTAICGASMGKWMLGLRVVRMTGERPTILDGVIRELGYFIDALFFGLIAKGQMEGSSYQQRLGDKWARTTVVDAKALPMGATTVMVLIGVGLGLVVHAFLLGLFFVLGAF